MVEKTNLVCEGIAAPIGLIHDRTREALVAELTEWGQPAFRARQLWHWLYRQFATDFATMENLPSTLRTTLAAHYRANPFSLHDRLQADDGVLKLALEAADGEIVETVCIPASVRRTVCVSTQVGCALGCTFCASARGGFSRNLTTGEIVAQVMTVAQLLEARPTHVVFMGMGEPLVNLDAVLGAVRILNDAEGLAIAARRITLSTCGIVPGIHQLAREGMQFELSVSLHAPDDALRNRLMPVNRRWPIRALLDACRAYAKRTGRIVTFEYTLVAGLNDHPDQARLLVKQLRDLPCRVNLIPLSPIPEFDGRAPNEACIQQFRTLIRRAGINVTVRQSRGGGVDAACGQLRRRSSARMEMEKTI